MNHIPQLSTAMTMRCSHNDPIDTSTWCGQPANWLRRGRGVFVDAFYCDAHRGETDVALAPGQPFRRVRVTLQVDLAGTSWEAFSAHRDAVDAIRMALEPLGAVVNLTTVMSAVVKNGPPRPAGKETAGQGSQG